MHQQNFSLRGTTAAVPFICLPAAASSAEWADSLCNLLEHLW